MTNTGATPAVNGGNTGAAVEGNGATAHATPAANGEAPLGWERAVSVARELGKDPRRLREYLTEQVLRQLANGASHQQRIPRANGGQAELWLSPHAAAMARSHFGTTPGADATAATPAVNGDATPDADATAETNTGATPAVAVDPSEGWRELAAELRAERDAMEARLKVAVLDAQQARKQADEAERGRVAFVEMLAHERAAWWQWVSYLKGLSLLRRLRGIPEPPEELRLAAKRLAAPQG